jgi:1-acyl-sn-glycerol-3-phosphate acyltransferase
MTTNADWLIDRLLGRELGARLASLRFQDAGHGFDRMGLSPAWVRGAVALTRPAYERYFRVTGHGRENVPSEGPVVLAANHSGMLPIDGAMIYLDLVRNLDPPRVPRAIADLFVPRLPFVYLGFNRTGVVTGDRATTRHLLEDGEMVLVFPEGTPGIGKPFAQRYQLQPFRVGHAELALSHRAPVVPVAVIGAEEQWPQLARIEAFHPFGAPYLPIPATPIPLPVRYHIWYGEPIHLHDRWSPEQADDPDVQEEAARLVQDAVQTLIDYGLSQREGIFR